MSSSQEIQEIHSSVKRVVCAVPDLLPPSELYNIICIYNSQRSVTICFLVRHVDLRIVYIFVYVDTGRLYRSS